MEIISPSYHPAQAATYGGSDFRPLQNTPTFDHADHFSLSIQPFRAGGYEATLRRVDLQKAADRAAIPRNYGKRVAQDERSQDSIDSSRKRAKAMVRKRVKDMGGDRLCTLTVRQNDELGYMSPDDWHVAFAKFIRLTRRAGLFVDYVAVMELHKKGLERLEARAGLGARVQDGEWDLPLHIHIVTKSLMKMPVNLMRKCWIAACGRSGNVDVVWLRAAHAKTDATDRVAGYVSKYITKGVAELERFNKKRYWAAGESLQKKGIEWMRSRDFDGAFIEALKRLGLLGSNDFDFCRNLFLFPDGSGCWINFRPSPDPSPPPF